MENMRAARAASGMSQAELAAAAGVSVRTIKRIEADTTHAVTVQAATQIAAALGVSLDYLIGGGTE